MAPLPRRLLAEFLGTGLLVTAVVGAGVMASRLSPYDVGLQLLENSVATALALGALILMFGPVSGSHLNPVVSAAIWWLGRRTPGGQRTPDGQRVLALVRSDRLAAAPAAVGAYIGAAYWFTSSTSFANPAVTVGRAFTDSFAGIAPASVPGFVAAQLLGAGMAVAATALLHPERE
jgi:arsenate reductase